MDSIQATEEAGNEPALCRTCDSDEGGGKMPCPECEEDADEVCRACGGLGTITCPDC
jgi:hypothetical protein